MIKSLTDREYQKFEGTADGSPAVRTFSIAQLIPKEYNKLELSYTGNNLTTISYFQNGTKVATLTLGWTANNLTSVERT